MNERIRYLDGLRGVLAVIVFVHHYFYIFCPDLVFGGNYQTFSHSGPFSFYKIIALTPVNIFFNPGMAIHFFFLLSGYVQTRTYFLKPEISFLQRSMLKRYFRLAIPVLSIAMLVYLFHSLFLIRKDLVPFNSLTSGWLSSLLPNTLKLHHVFLEGLVNSFRGNSRYYQILWTMPTELINSFLVLCLLLVFHNLKFKLEAFLVLILVQFIVLQEYYSVAFTAGMVFAKLEADSRRFKIIFSKPIIHYACLLLGLYFGSYPFTGYQNAAANSVYAPISFFEVYPHIISYLIGVIFLFCYLLYSKTGKTVLAKKPFLFFGDISFMFYLVHFLILLSLAPLIYSLLKNKNSSVDFIVTGLVSFVAVTAAAYVFTRLIDKPTVKWCNHFARKFFQEKT